MSTVKVNKSTRGIKAMMTLEEVKERLKPMNLQYVARETGIHGNVLYRICKGQRNPSYATVKKISDWLEDLNNG